jgi:outer membrane autotransporter protein
LGDLFTVRHRPALGFRLSAKNQKELKRAIPMRIKVFATVLFAAVTVGSSAGVAQQVINGAIPTPLNATGVTSGVSMTGQGGGGTLIVGTIGGPQSDIFTNNSSGGTVTNTLLRAVSTDTSSQSNIVFNSSSNVFGALGITNPGGPFFLNINGGNNGTAVNFNGSLFGTITTVSGTGALNFNSGSTNITATNFAGNGTISLSPNTKLIGALTTNTANTGTLTLAGGSALTGAVGGANGLKAVNVAGGSNTAGVSATISGAVNAYAFNLGTNTLNVGGALTIANLTASGVINTTLASTTVYGNIKTVGASNLGPTLLVNVAVPQTAFFPVGTQFTIVQAGSGTNGSVVTVVNDPTNPLFTFSAVPLAGTVAGQVVIQTTGIPLTVPVAPPAGVVLPPTQIIAAPVVPAVLAAAAASAPTSDLLSTVLPAINAISDAATVVNAVAQLAPSNSALGASQVTFEGARAFQGLLSSHLSEGLCGGGSQTADRRRHDDPRKPHDESSGCPENNQYEGLWLKGFGYFGDQGAQGAFAGYDSTVLGAMLGYDVAVADNTRAGLGIGYARSKIDGKALNNTTGFNTYQATAYIAHEDGTWFADGDVSYGRNSYSGRRQIAFPGISRTAFAKYSGEDITGFVTTGRHFFTDDVTITPLVSLQVTHLNLNGYTETGAGDINLQVSAQSYNFLESGLGVNVARHFDLEDGRDLLPEVHFKWLHELLNPNIQNTAMFTATGSTPFVTTGLNTAPDTLDMGAGLTLLSCGCSERTWSVEGIYDFFWRNQNYSAHQVTLAASYRF